MKITITIFIISILSFTTYAHHGLEGASGGGFAFNFTNSSLTLAKNKWLFQYYTEYRTFRAFDQYAIGEISKTDYPITELAWVWGNAVRINYGLTNRITLSAQLPFAKFSEKTLSPDSGQIIYEQLQSLQFGDVSIIANYMFFNNIKSGWQASLMGGIELPTGFQPETETNIISGSGSWDPMLGAVLAKRWKRIKVTANSIYKLTAKNKDEIDYGDYLYYQATSTFALNKEKSCDTTNAQVSSCKDSCTCSPKAVNWFLSMGFTGEKQFKQTNHAVEFGNTGFYRNYATVGITAATKNWAFSLGYDFVVAQKVNGFQNKISDRIQASIALLL